VGFNTTGMVAVENNGTTMPNEFTLSQNYPNPFNPATVINYQIPEAGNVKLSIYDDLGREVNVLVNGVQNAGAHKIEWDASAFPSGVYFYRIDAGAFVSTKKMILIK